MVSRVAVLSDIHGMLPALERVLNEAAVLSAELIVVTGDHTWGPQPAQVLDRLTALGERAVLIRGNADRELLSMSRGIDVGLDDDPVSAWGATQLTASHQALLDTMPESATIDIDGFGHVFFSHATPRSDDEVVLVDSRIDRWREIHRDLASDVRTVVCGHTHMPFARVVDRRLVVNPGSVGLPYGQAGAHWAVLDGGSVTLSRTAIDADDLIREVTASSTMPGVAAWLEDAVRHPASDADALAAFGPRDGR
ncbi:YfcE family phosphodiesterase [Curtobacterium sp. MCBD17_040]|uniref:metallophosphoesterase family protein n=1 Tax=Curtobacterium sp. MCBD17_040 TaxID=2175674 RepID=UPI000DA9B342|nr:YfcE family phosphodiesterase [Curtobacterium sp. MCBD17_040]WIB65750.1 YfcE family phosphodiesterase [Curtobacterium sp. MCBD17_040]